jgi:hypothetical protein
MKTILTTFTILIFALTSCKSTDQLNKQNEWISQSFIIPNNYNGPFYIITDNKNGVIRNVKNGIVQEKIPVDGILLVKEWGYNDTIDVKYVSQIITHHFSDGSNIKYMPTEGMGIWILGGWLPKSIQNKYSTFRAGMTGFIGTKEEYENYKKDQG